MTQLQWVCSVALAATVLAIPAGARRDKPRTKNTAAFDYYVLSLSWSPEHCSTPSASSSDPQCNTTRRNGFIVHGLWPQSERGYPASCPSKAKLDEATASSMLDIMPSPKLIRHEWEKHGTCSGMDAKQYFTTVRNAFNTIKIPARYQNPTTAHRTRTNQVKLDFRQANVALDMNEIAVLCDGRFLQEVRICLDKNLYPRACGPDIRDRCRSEIAVRPVR